MMLRGLRTLGLHSHRALAYRHVAPVFTPALRQSRGYREHNSMECLLSASEDWHRLVPDRILDDEASLRAAFDKLDLDGNGKIDAFE